MVSRRDFLKVSAAGLLSLFVPPSPKKRKKKMPIQWMSQDQTVYKSGLSTYEHDFEAGASLDPANPGNLLGRVVGVTIIGSATVTQLRAYWSGAFQQWKNLTFVRADTNGSYRTELWYLPNTVPGTFTFEVTFSSAIDSVLGFSAYLFFGGIGAHDGATGTGNPALKALTTLQDNSIVLANLTTQTTTGVTHVANQRNRWTVNNALGTSMGGDTTLISPPASKTMQFDGITAGHAWAVSCVELLSLVPNPPAIMGL